ncbi:hypothetical protein [Streptomyces clavifer]|uniref:hypothetical protein n=1 Tax=Streptomyces clavifer TaxID=68188 RepID=UPI00368268A5
MTTLIAAGALSAGLLSVGSTATASASTQPHVAASQAITQGIQPPTSHSNWVLGVAGAPTEYLQGVSGLTDREVTFTRFSGVQSIVDTWLRDPSRWRPAYITIDVLDWQGNSTRHYEFRYPQLTRVVNNGGTQTLTVTFSQLIIT